MIADLLHIISETPFDSAYGIGFRVTVKPRGEDWTRNQIVYRTETEAQRAGEDLFARWTTLESFRIEETR